MLPVLASQVGAATETLEGIAGEQAQVAATVEIDQREAAPIDQSLVEGIGAAGAETDIVADIDQVGVDPEQRSGRLLRRAARAQHRRPRVVVAGRMRHAGEAHIGRRERHRRVRRRGVAEGVAAGVEPQTLRHRQRDVAVECEQAVDQQRQIAEAAGDDTVDAEPRRTGGERAAHAHRGDVAL